MYPGYISASDCISRCYHRC